MPSEPRPTGSGGAKGTVSSGFHKVQTAINSDTLGKYQGFIYLGLAIGAYSLAETRLAPAIAALLGVAVVMELISYQGNKIKPVDVPAATGFPTGSLNAYQGS